MTYSSKESYGGLGTERDPWIPRGPFCKPITPKRRCRLRWVSELLLPEGGWNEQLVRQHFFPIDTDEILKIKRSRSFQDDFIVWQPDKQGIFSVRSAYRLGLDVNMNDQGGSKQ